MLNFEGANYVNWFKPVLHVMLVPQFKNLRKYLHAASQYEDKERPYYLLQVLFADNQKSVYTQDGV